MSGIMESTLHVCSSEEMCLGLFLNFSNMISCLIVLGSEFQSFGS